MGAFENKVCIVVGGGRGIGRATALALAREGARVVIDDNGCATDGTGHDPDVAASAAAAICDAGGEALALSHDARDPQSARLIIEAARQAFGRVDAGLYCAGFTRERPLLRLSDDELDSLLDVQVRSSVRFTRELARALIEQKSGGSILLTTASPGFFGSAAQSASAAAAGAVASFTRTAAIELRRQGVRVNALLPTARTRLTEQLPLFQSIRADSLSAEHVAQAACHLLSEAAHELHGEIIGVAGGRIYALRTTETSGAFREGPPASLPEIGTLFRDATRS